MLTIGKLAAETGVKVPTVRYYEQIGLLPPPEHSSGNQRLYGPLARQRLAFIRHGRALGFLLDAICSACRIGLNCPVLLPMRLPRRNWPPCRRGSRS